MIRIRNVFLGAIALLLSGTASAELSVAVVDVQQALINTDAWQQANESWIEEFKADRDQWDVFRDQFNALVEQGRRDSTTMSETERKKLEGEIQVLNLQAQQIATRIQEGMQGHQNQFLESKRQALSDAMQSITDEGEYDLILNHNYVVFASTSINITALLTAKLNELI